MASLAEPKAHVLVVDDDPLFRDTLTDYLNTNSYAATAVASLNEARAELARKAIDLVILDLTLPGEDGLSLAAELRAARTPPFIILSARAEMVDRVVGLEIGADDYLAKPVQLRELLARMTAVLRRSERALETASGKEGDDLATLSNGVTYHPEQRMLSGLNRERLELTTAEARLLECLLKGPKRIFSREQIGHAVYGADWDGFDRSIDQLVSRLRRKIETSGADARYLQTLRSEGYRWTQSVSWSRR